MGLWKMFKEDMKALFPESVKIYDNKETGEFAFEVVNKPNSLSVPLVSRSYDDENISLWELTNNKSKTGFWDEVKQLKNKELKKLEADKDGLG